MLWTSRLVGAAAVLALAAAPAAGRRADETVPLGWYEQHSAYGRHFKMTFRVDSLTLAASRWHARVLFKNDTNQVLLVRPRFRLITTRPDGRTSVLAATSFDPKLPAQLGILQRWVGTVGGPGTPPSGSLRLRLGDFRISTAPNLVISHLTRHAYAWRR